MCNCSYYKDAEKTAEAIDTEGWHHTGDVGMWLPNGTLRIIDRRKHIFKLSQGEYIVPEKIENIYTLSQYVNQVYVYGESLKVSPTGVSSKIRRQRKCNRNYELINIKGGLLQLC